MYNLNSKFGSKNYMCFVIDVIHKAISLRREHTKQKNRGLKELTWDLSVVS